MEFFTASDIKHFGQIAGKTYRSYRKRDTDARDIIKKSVWSKTQYWADQVEQRLNQKYRVDFKMIWSQRGLENGQQVSTFKPYTWARFYKIQDANKDIYFTIGVDGPSERLIIKLDYQRRGETTLSQDQTQMCHQVLRPDLERYWISLSLADLNQNVTSWDALLTRTISGIHEFESAYDNVIKQVWPNEVRLARIAYNTMNWLCPSGAYGKSSNPDNHEAKYGYGYEEWLLDFGKRIDDHHYGFLEPVRTNLNAYQGQTFNVWLYAINAITKERFWVGFIRNMQVLTRDQVETAWTHYERKGWLDEMRQQINHVAPEEHDFSDHIGNAIFNIRFKPEETIIYPEPIKVDVNSPVMGYRRYTFIRSQNVVLPEIAHEEKFDFTAGEHGRGNGLTTATYDRNPKTILLERQHSILSYNLYQHLSTVYGKENIGTENRTSYNTVIDLVRCNGDDYYFYEIKIYPSLKQCIREAVGQLLEYSYWPTGRLAKELIIVTVLPANQEVKDYMNNLRLTLGLPIFYQQFALSKMELEDKV